MRGIFLLGVILAIILLGARAPYLFVLGYVWASIFTPQLLAYSIIPSIPISLIFALLSFCAFFIQKKERHIVWRPQSIIVGLLAVWMTATLLWAVAPDAAYSKWDWAIKSIAFTIIIPFFIRGKIELELFIWVILISGMAHCMSFAAKVVLSGGGYGVPLGLVGGNTGYGEGSTLAMFSVSLVPLAIYLYFHQTLINNERLVKWMLIAFIVFSLLTAIGTYARTGLVCMAVLAACLIYYGRRKLLSALVVVVLAGVVYPFIDTEWLTRMSSINSDVDQSAMGRVAVWKWVIEYIAYHPLGGSFEMYRINSYAMELSDGSVLRVASKAFHNIYIEVLGEGGILGFVMFVLIILMTLMAFMRHKKILVTSGEQWLGDVGRYLLICTLIYLVGGLFIGVAFQSYFYYLVALSAAYVNLSAKYESA